MKRPLGLIGLTYLLVLAVVFYVKSDLFFNLVVVCSVLLIFGSAIYCVVDKIYSGKVRLKIGISLVAVGLSSLFACTVLFFHTNLVYTPIINNYCEKTLNINGYICDEIIRTPEKCVFTVQTETINNKAEKIKIQILLYRDVDFCEFDYVSGTITTTDISDENLAGKGIYLSAYGEAVKLNSTGEQHFSLYNYAVKLRKKLKNSIDLLLPYKYASLSKAVLLGEKINISYDVKNAFSSTGTSFLIVVSGFHLSVVAGLVKRVAETLTKNFRRSAELTCIAVILIVCLYMAVTGFTPSVVRSATMTIIAYTASLLLRTSSPINSIGAAAIICTLGNPYSVGDIGLLLSFSSTLGIILWADKIDRCIISHLGLRNSILRYISNLISVSISATVWIIPITTIFWGSISYLSPIISLLLEPAVNLLLICLMLTSVIYLIPIISFLAYPFALISGILSKYIIGIVTSFASLPNSVIATDNIWVTIVIVEAVAFVIIGYIIKAKPNYIRMIVIILTTTSLIGYTLTVSINKNKTYLDVYSVGNGITASISCNNNISFISCGGSKKNFRSSINRLSKKYAWIDKIIVPNTNSSYSQFQYNLIEEFNIANLLIHDVDKSVYKVLNEYDGQGRAVFGENIKFTIPISDNTTDTVININGSTYQLITTDKTRLLLILKNSDVQDLPEEYRNVDYILTDGIPKNYSLLRCDTLIFSGTDKKYKEYEEKLNAVSKKVLSTIYDDVKISLN